MGLWRNCVHIAVKDKYMGVNMKKLLGLVAILFVSCSSPTGPANNTTIKYDTLKDTIRNIKVELYS